MIFFRLLCLSILAIFTQVSIAQSVATLNVLTYNVHHCNPPGKPEGFIDIPAIARVIADSKADLVALQEIDVNTERSGKGTHQAAELARLTGMHYFFAKAIDHQGGDYGVAVLSRFPILDSIPYPLPIPDGIKGEPRVVAAVNIKTPTGQGLWFASTHLDLKEETRLFQADLIVKRFGDLKEPLILAGDFNAKPQSGEIAFLDQTFARTCIDNCPPTSPQSKPRNAIDFIMYTKSSGIRTLEHAVINETYASDHLPVAAKLSLP